MDKQLSETFNHLSQQNGVVGYSVVDENGLCLKAHGPGQNNNAGFYKSLLDKSRQLSEGSEVASVTIETDTTNIFIQHNQKITLAVSKLP
ncbi:hypothetical protein DICPUDRAFT_87541 [Dictyostelium purpureum]|uniref:Late endosomal/lysosomal adaptor and MAPK and MTOR activator 5 n=1 Tax=Dictyostelium purpureum TaxID=5786 RepID=F0ZIT5_DICPU|nr:uncharacterized protein DICPUDRAFT_87541 [Dictyostelium purpureum]EGC36132.1 hypothetical protein DICPUDRAFT_87541 [Dictyostelium purpureum]|eukprot:XP_003287325.1 hypothetical protein DICPUDRAFT_87541 [Dictyostelium purpureum]